MEIFSGHSLGKIRRKAATYCGAAILCGLVGNEVLRCLRNATLMNHFCEVGLVHEEGEGIQSHPRVTLYFRSDHLPETRRVVFWNLT